MTLQKQLLTLFLVFTGIILMPYIGGYIHFDGVFPDGFFAFPPLSVPDKAPFNIWIFGAISIAFVVVFLVYAFPKLFGFKGEAPEPRPDHAKLPSWFWVGLILFLIPLIILWGKFQTPKFILNWAVFPMFWGFTFILDAIVYVRSGGDSMWKRRPRELMAIGMASIAGWLIFEYLNFFVDDNWMYPFGNLIPQEEFFMYAIIGSSGLMPMAFEWYDLFQTFKGFPERYSHGIKITLPSFIIWILLIGSMVGLFLTSFAPDDMFFVLWVAPLVAIACGLSLLGIWTPFTPIKEGNWAPFMLMSLSYFVQGFLCECWNYFSGIHNADGSITTYNPDYWVYSIPYVNKFHIFEMPILGFLGYLPFGAYCWVWWIFFAFVFNISSKYTKNHAVLNEVAK